jgi:hypothetical protein
MAIPRLSNIYVEISLTDDERNKLRAIHRRLRTTHQKMFDLQGEAIAGLREALAAVAATHDEMLAFFQATSDLEDLGED